MRHTETVIFKTDWGWVGLAAVENGSGAGICRVVLPSASKKTVQRVLEAHLRARAEAQDTRRENRGQDSDGNHLLRTASSSSVLRQAQTQVVEFVAGRRREFDFPVDLSAGTPFQRRVWRVLDRIPYGRVRSYKWVAARVGGIRYARAVGLALGANHVPIAIPCHRVVAHDGSVGGFTGGLAAKRKLLKLEGTLRQLRRGRRHS